MLCKCFVKFSDFSQWLIVLSAEVLEEAIARNMTSYKDATGLNMWSCVVCNMEQRKKHNMKRHVEAFHVGGFVHSCHICGSKHKTKAAVDAHFYTFHYEKPKQS